MRLNLLAALATVLALAVLPASAGAGDPPAPGVETLLVLNLDGDIDIDPDGSVAGFRLRSTAPGKVAAMLEQAALKWRFDPVLIDGVPAKVTARTRVTLGATQKGEDFEVWLDNVLFPGETHARGSAPDADSKRGFDNESVDVLAKAMPPPGYPIGLMKAGIGARVLLGLRIGEDGRVAEVIAVQSQLFDVRGSDRNLARAIELFEKSAIAGAKAWRFEVKPKGAGDIPANKLTAVTTVEYIPSAGPSRGPKELDRPGQWRWITRLPKRAMPWLPAEPRQDVGVSDMMAGEVFPLQSKLRLASDVRGKML
jgi:hypothetical protein